MIRNYLLVGWRTLWRHKTQTFINVLGLSIAFAAGTLLFLTAYIELSYDRFNADADRIFRPYFFENRSEGIQKNSGMPYPMAPTLKKTFPEIEQITRYTETAGIVQYKGKDYQKDIRTADPDLLTLFSFPMLQGDARRALNNLSDIVISEDMARDVFGKENPIGKPLLVKDFGEPKQFIVTGVVANARPTSSITYDAFIRTENRPNYAADKDNWHNGNHLIYVKLRPDIDRVTMEQRLQSFTQTYFQETIRDLSKNGALAKQKNDAFSLRLQPLLDVHFNTELTEGMSPGKVYVYTLLTIGLLIVLIASINFINLALARSFTRMREVGVRKSLGALRVQLFSQLWSESLLTCFIALLIGLGLAIWLLPDFNTLFNAQLTLDYLTNPISWAVILAGFGLIAFISGGYPAWVMARLPAVKVLRGQIKTGKPGSLRNGLIILQFVITCVLITSTFVVLRQIHYLRDQPLGFNEDQVISIPINQNQNGPLALERLRNRLANNPNIVSVSGTAINIGSGLDGGYSKSTMGFIHKGKEIRTNWVRADYDYLKTLGIKLLAGREFSGSYAMDTISNVIITTSMAHQLGVKNPVGTFFQAGADNTTYQIVGLIPDFHLYDLRNKLEPVTLYMKPNDPIRYILVRVTPQSMVSVMEVLKHEWKQIAPKQEFWGSFLNENTDRWYRREEQLSKMYGIAAGIAIALSCLGLFAIVLLSTEQRTKEIGIRKVLGASVMSVVTLISKDFLRLLLVAILIASPIAWYAMNQWLQEFAYRIDVEWWVLAGSGLLAIVIALLTVGYQSLNAALANPVKSLSNE
ncbi:FtsX-like permease family protein [Spirosoma sp. HMF4905]|uniref:FtsX-like permease family protein n=2 Tax=Spirosoma arboris TaxID=2682092 RepID=A0A7K1SBQ1_9BACT|nr:FtsX-like permease family protein [Spirosoma arboris]